MHAGIGLFKGGDFSSNGKSNSPNLDKEAWWLGQSYRKQKRRLIFFFYVLSTFLRRSWLPTTSCVLLLSITSAHSSCLFVSIRWINVFRFYIKLTTHLFIYLHIFCFLIIYLLLTYIIFYIKLIVNDYSKISYFHRGKI